MSLCRRQAACARHLPPYLQSKVDSYLPQRAALWLEESGAEGALGSEEVDVRSGFSEPVTRPRSLAPVTVANLSIS